MRCLWLLSLAGPAVLGLCNVAFAAPLVISGLGPEDATVRVAPRAARPVTTGAYGGGFLELLITGRDPTPSLTRTPQPRRLRPVVPVPISAAAPLPITPSPPSLRPVSYAAPPELSAGVRHFVSPISTRQEINYGGPEKPGTIVVDTRHKYLFFVLGDGRALRYDVGVGRPGFEWAGIQKITRKVEWPGWTPPAQMLLRQPNLPRHMAGGPDNPLGARALYLGSSLYRIHGTNDPATIGKNVSSGCIRMMNADVKDLYNRVNVGTKVVVF